jgi:Protein tyrosine and serine/threonine kinase
LIRRRCQTGQSLGKIIFPSSGSDVTFYYSYEVDREKVIGIGFFSDVYRGTWRGRTVAIKVLAESTPRDLFTHEMAIWAKLRHSHVLKLYGASSAAGDPPWFFVMPYEKNGNLVQYLKVVEAGWSGGGGMRTGAGAGGSGLSVDGGGRSSGKGQTTTSPVRSSPSGNTGRGQLLEGRPGSAGPKESGAVPREWDLYRFMHEIAKGMEYLHANGVLHGDLKVDFSVYQWMVRLIVVAAGGECAGGQQAPLRDFRFWTERDEVRSVQD